MASVPTAASSMELGLESRGNPAWSCSVRVTRQKLRVTLSPGPDDP